MEGATGLAVETSAELADRGGWFEVVRAGLTARDVRAVA